MRVGIRIATCGSGGGDLIVRTLMASDSFPEGFETGYEKMPVMKSWCWVAEENGDAAGVLLAAPMHGIAYLMVIRVHPKAPNMTLLLLLRQCMRDCVKRGFKGFCLHIAPTAEDGENMRKMIPLVRRSGGVQVLQPHVFLVGSTEKAARL